MIKTLIGENSEFFEREFTNLSFPGERVEKIVFEGCLFKNVNCSEAHFVQCKFVNCEFINCNLSSVQFDRSAFSEVIISESKALGINWTKLNWPYIKLQSPLQLYKSIISHSNFYELELKELVIEECVAHDVDFRRADLSSANFKATDFQNSQFIHTKLYKADFTEAHNYRIDPRENDIKKAKFSLPDAINLLDAFDIQVI